MKILAISDIVWSGHEQLRLIIERMRPDLVIIAGDVCQDGQNLSSGYAKQSMRLLRILLQQVEDSQITTLLIKGNWDDKGTEYSGLFSQNHFRFVQDISEKYLQFNGLTFLGLPFSCFGTMKNVRSLGQRFPQPADFIIAHPPTKRRIWALELQPQVAIMGHDDLRICRVLGTLLVTTNCSPNTFAAFNVNRNSTHISYYQTQGPVPYALGSRDSESKRHRFKGMDDYLTFDASWNTHTKSLLWHSEEHSNHNPSAAYPVKDSDYGKMLETLLLLKQSTTRSDIIRELPRLRRSHTPMTLIHEYLGIAWDELRPSTNGKGQ